MKAPAPTRGRDLRLLTLYVAMLATAPAALAQQPGAPIQLGPPVQLGPPPAAAPPPPSPGAAVPGREGRPGELPPLEQPAPRGPAPSDFKPLQRPPGGTARAATLQGLDKQAARAQRLDAPLGQAARFGTLSITVEECLVNAPDARPEAAARLTIVDRKPGEQPVQLFSGWMFASSPALSALDHAVYDVTVLGCVATVQASAPAKAPK
jgi:hypothetical protein